MGREEEEMRGLRGTFQKCAQLSGHLNANNKQKRKSPAIVFKSLPCNLLKKKNQKPAYQFI